METCPTGRCGRFWGDGLMGFPWKVLLEAFLVLVIGLVAQNANGEFGLRRKAIDPQRLNAARGYPTATTDPIQVPGPLPYWGQALGSTYYNWGYFGARQHAQFTQHSGYYGEYIQFGYTKGY